MSDDHPRISTRELCALARYSRATLWRRIDAGDMPAPIDRGGEGFLFDRGAVLLALGMKSPETVLPEPAVEVDFDPADLREAIARRNRRKKGAAWRDRKAKKSAGA